MRRSLLSVTLAALAALLAAPGGQAAGGLQPKLTPIGHVKFPERGFLVDFGRHVALGRDDVRVWENGRPVEALSFAPAGKSSQRIGVVLVVDASDSMRGRPLADAFAAARSLSPHVGGSERVGLVTFNSHTRVVLAPTADRAAFARATRRVPRTSQGTNLYDALVRAVDVLHAQRVAAGSIVLISDGADTGSQARPAQVAARARAEHVRIFTIGLHSRTFDPAQLRALALETGGAYSPASSSRELRAISGAIGAQLARDYVLRYRSRAVPGEAVRVLVEAAGAGSTIAAYAAPKHGAAEPFHRSTLERFWAWSGSFAVIALLAAAFVFAGALALLRGRRPNLRERMAHFITPAGDSAAQRTRRRPLVTRLLLARTERSLGRTRWWARFEEELEIAEIRFTPAQIVAGSLLGTLLVGLLLVLAAPVFALFALAVPLVAHALCRRRLRKVRDGFADRLPETLQVLSSALRAGHSFSASLSVVAADAEGPTRREFERVAADEQLGVPLDVALMEVARRMDNPDLEQVALVAELQRQTGGNMAEVLDRVVETIRGRFDLRRLVTTLTAQGRMARWIVSLLPVFLFAVIWVINPGYEATLYTSTGGQIALAVAALMVISGSFVIKRIVDIKV